MGEYSIETKNRFQLALDDDDEDVDVYDILKEVEAKKAEKQKPEQEVSKNTKNTKNDKKDKPAKKPGLKVDNANVTNIQNTQNKGFSKGNENRPPRMRQTDFPKTDNFEKPPAQDQNSGSGTRGFRGGRGGYRGRGGDRGRGGIRRFDRHSGSERTGVKSVEKREGFGSHNWGSEIDGQLDSSVQEENKETEVGEKNVTDGEQTTINAEDSGADPEPPAEPEVKEMTLDEWKAAQAGSRTKQQFNVRRAGEGEDPKQWKKTVALEPRKRAESTESYEEDEHEAHQKNEDGRAALDKLNIQFVFNDNARGSPSGGRGGGGRGRGRGFGGGRPPRRGGRNEYGGGFNRNSRPENYAPRVDNESEFPSLGSK